MKTVKLKKNNSKTPADALLGQEGESRFPKWWREQIMSEPYEPSDILVNKEMVAKDLKEIEEERKNGTLEPLPY